MSRPDPPLVDRRARLIYDSHWRMSARMLLSVVMPVYNEPATVAKPVDRVLFFWHYVGNKFLTLLSNMLTNLNLTNMETGYTNCFAAKTSSPSASNQTGSDSSRKSPQKSPKKWRLYEVPV